jgi:hypothetical protein
MVPFLFNFDPFRESDVMVPESPDSQFGSGDVV